LGSVRFVSEEHKIPEAVKKQVYELEEQGKTIIFVSSHKEVIGIIAITDTIRQESKTTVEDLHKLGIEVVMLTGDHQKAGEVIAHKIGITHTKG
jgi:P-type E1-E2 ATPase